MPLNRKYRIGGRGKRRRKPPTDQVTIAGTTPVDVPAPDEKTIQEEVFEEMEGIEHRRDTGVAGLDTAVDKVLYILANEVEPCLSEIIEESDSLDLEVARELRGLLDEAIYPYMREVAEQVDQLLGEGE